VASAITVNHLVKRYGPVTAVNDISFDVAAGSLFAFLGANGAGKSTTINCLNTRLRADGGELEVAGHRAGKDDDAIRRAIGVVFQMSLLDPLLTVRENLLVRGRFYGISNGGNVRVEELSSLVDLTSFLDRPYGTLSGGEKRRADIARALIHNPSVLFLDEPTAGLDPASRETVWAAISNLRHESGLTVFLTTHYMQETERADDICVIDAGSIVADGTPTTLRATYAQDELSLTVNRIGEIRSELESGGYAVQQQADVLQVKVHSSADSLTLLKRYEADVLDFEFRHGTMDDVFLSLIGPSATRRSEA